MRLKRDTASTGEILTLSSEQLRKMQLLQLDMMCEVDRVCRTHNIKYCIVGGTLLGAIRHKGFIPWDDDADICMLREEYNRFLLISSELSPEICYFQDHSTDPEYRWGYGKLRRTETTYIRTGQEHLKFKTGVCIDVAPLDDVPNGKIARCLHTFKCFLLRKALWAEVGKYSAKGLEKLCLRMLAHIPLEVIFAQLEQMASKSKSSASNDTRILTLPCLRNHFIKKEWLLDRREYEFEGKHFFGPADYDAYLKSQYGDYMTLPPENERKGHAPASSFYF